MLRFFSMECNYICMMKKIYKQNIYLYLIMFLSMIDDKLVNKICLQIDIHVHECNVMVTCHIKNVSVYFPKI